MKNTLKYGKATYHYEDESAERLYTPQTIMRLRQVYAQGVHWTPKLGDRTLLLLLKRRMPKVVSFTRAYTGWRESGAREEFELGEGRAFMRWLQKHELGILWDTKDILLHPFFHDPSSPRHDPTDETAQSMSFAIAPVKVSGRPTKLYMEDHDMLRLLNVAFGIEEDFIELVQKYVLQRHQWQKWQAPAPGFVDWLTNMCRKPVFARGQLGFSLPAALG